MSVISDLLYQPRPEPTIPPADGQDEQIPTSAPVGPEQDYFGDRPGFDWGDIIPFLGERGSVGGYAAGKALEGGLYALDVARRPVSTFLSTGDPSRTLESIYNADVAVSPTELRRQYLFNDKGSEGGWGVDPKTGGWSWSDFFGDAVDTAGDLVAGTVPDPLAWVTLGGTTAAKMISKAGGRALSNIASRTPGAVAKAAEFANFAGFDDATRLALEHEARQAVISGAGDDFLKATGKKMPIDPRTGQPLPGKIPGLEPTLQGRMAAGETGAEIAMPFGGLIDAAAQKVTGFNPGLGRPLGNVPLVDSTAQKVFTAINPIEVYGTKLMETEAGKAVARYATKAKDLFFNPAIRDTFGRAMKASEDESIDQAMARVHERAKPIQETLDRAGVAGEHQRYATFLQETWDPFTDIPKGVTVTAANARTFTRKGADHLGGLNTEIYTEIMKLPEKQQAAIFSAAQQMHAAFREAADDIRAIDPTFTTLPEKAKADYERTLEAIGKTKSDLEEATKKARQTTRDEMEAAGTELFRKKFSYAERQYRTRDIVQREIADLDAQIAKQQADPVFVGEGSVEGTRQLDELLAKRQTLSEELTNAHITDVEVSFKTGRAAKSMNDAFEVEQRKLAQKVVEGEKDITVVNPHPVTGMKEGKWANKRYVQLGLERATPENPLTYIEGDLKNLGGLNAKLGNTGADEHFGAMASIARRELESLGGEIAFTTKGGDEFGFTVLGIPKEQIDAALAKAEKDIDAYVKANGLDKIEHGKGKHLEGGTGIKFSGKQYDPAIHKKGFVNRKTGKAVNSAEDALIADADNTLEGLKKGVREGDATMRAAPDVTKSTDTVAKIPLTVTRDMRQQLYDLGFNKADVDHMKPAQAWEQIQSGRNKVNAKAEGPAAPPQQSGVWHDERQFKEDQRELERLSKKYEELRQKVRGETSWEGVPPTEKELSLKAKLADLEEQAAAAKKLMDNMPSYAPGILTKEAKDTASGRNAGRAPTTKPAGQGEKSFIHGDDIGDPTLKGVPLTNYEIMKLTQRTGTRATGYTPPSTRKLWSKEGWLKVVKADESMVHNPAEVLTEYYTGKYLKTVTTQRLHKEMLSTFNAIPAEAWDIAVKMAKDYGDALPVSMIGVTSVEAQAAREAAEAVVKANGPAEIAATFKKMTGLDITELMSKENAAAFKSGRITPGEIINAVSGPGDGAWRKLDDFAGPGKHVYLPAEIERRYNNYKIKSVERLGETIASMLGPITTFMSYWKPLQVLWPATQIRNIIGDTSRLIQTNAYDGLTTTNMRMYSKGAFDGALSNRNFDLYKDDIIDLGIHGQMSGADFAKLASRHGIINTGREAEQLLQAARKTAKADLTAAGRAFDNVKGGTLDKYTNALVHKENVFRLSAFATRMRAGDDIFEASLAVEEALYNQARISPAADFLRKTGIAPFISWNAKNLPAQIEYAFTHPGHFAAMLRGLELSQGEDIPEDVLPQYLKEKFNIVLRKEKGADGKQQWVYVTNSGIIPMVDLAEIMRSLPNREGPNAIKEWLGPIAKQAADWYSGEYGETKGDDFWKGLAENVGGKLVTVPKQFANAGQVDPNTGLKRPGSIAEALNLLSPTRIKSLDIEARIEKSDGRAVKALQRAKGQAKRWKQEYARLADIYDEASLAMVGAKWDEANKALEKAQAEYQKTTAENARVREKIRVAKLVP